MNKYISIALASITLAGCSSGEEVSLTDDTSTPICLSAGIATSIQVAPKGRAVEAFPNSGKIAVTAAIHKNSSTEWNSVYIDNKLAGTTQSVESGSAYAFDWDIATPDQWGNKTYYWSFNPDEKLVFVAYSPNANGTTLKPITNSKTSLDITLGGNMPDVMYTKPTGALNKESGNVDLGEFQHALAKVVIRVKAVNTDEEDISTDKFKVTDINVKTKITTATFDLPTSTLKLGSKATSYTSFPLFNTETALTKEIITKELYVLPGSEASTVIGLSLTDGVLNYGKNGENNGYEISEFNGNPVPTFIAGQTTLLTFKIEVKDVSTGDGDKSTIILKGDLEDWKCQGGFEVGIE